MNLSKEMRDRLDAYVWQLIRDFKLVVKGVDHPPREHFIWTKFSTHLDDWDPEGKISRGSELGRVFDNTLRRLRRDYRIVRYTVNDDYTKTALGNKCYRALTLLERIAEAAR